MQIFYLKTVILTSLLMLSGKSGSQSLIPENLPEVSFVIISGGDLNLAFIDNSARAPFHKKGYNGIASLIHKSEPSNIFVPDYAGFNLEHIYGGDSLVQLFEPRLHPMRLFQKNATEVFLYQEATPISKVESLTQFSLVEPHFIDITFQCILHDTSFFRHHYAGLFWASYIRAPVDKMIYFEGNSEADTTTRWIASYSSQHGVSSTHRAVDDHFSFYFANNFNAVLANHFSDYRFIKPYYYGRYNDMVLAYFFKTDQVVRFSQSPTGGGSGNPAWDFQFLIPNPSPHKIYTFKARLLYKSFISEHDLGNEYDRWSVDK